MLNQLDEEIWAPPRHYVSLLKAKPHSQYQLALSNIHLLSYTDK